MSDTINNRVPTPTMVYGRNPSGTLEAATTDGSGNLNVNVQVGGGSGGSVNVTGINGSPPALTNPLPVELSDGTNAFGTAGNPLSVSDPALELSQGSTTSGQKGVLVQGAVASGSGPTLVTAQTSPLSLATTGGGLRVDIRSINNGGNNVLFPVVSSTSLADGTGAVGFTTSGAGAATGCVQNYVSTGPANVAANNTAQRTPNIFKTATVNANAAGNAAVWTPTAGKKFRLMKFQITGVNLAATAGTVITLSFQDNVTGITSGTYDVLLPPVATATDILAGGFAFNTTWIDLGNGFLSAAANNVLNLNVSAAPAGAQGSYRVNVCGTEE